MSSLVTSNTTLSSLTDEQQLILNNVREFVQTEVKPRAPQIDKTAQFPHDLFKRCAELGLTGLAIDEEYGGLGQGVLMEQLVMEEIAKECPVLALILDAHLLSYRLINHFGSKEQKKRFIPPTASGAQITAMASTEATGSTNFAEQQPMGKRDGDGIILNGTKLFTTNSDVAGFYIVQGMVDGEFVNVIVEKGTPGLETGAIDHKLGMAGSSTGTVRFKNLRVPKENILAEHSDVQDASFALCFLNISSISIGLAEGVLEKTKTYLLNRTRNHKPLAGFQVVAHHLAKMQTQIELAKSILERAAKLYDEGRPDVVLTFMTKAFACEMAVDVANLCIQLHGAAGYMEETGIARYLRDAKCNTIGEISTDIHYDYIALRMGLPIDTSFPLFG